MSLQNRMYLAMFLIWGVLIVYIGINARSLNFNPVSADFIIGLLTPLFVISLFLERAQEVFIKTWRGMGREKIVLDKNLASRERDLAVANKDLLGVQTASAKFDQAEKNLSDYKSQTRRIAFLGGTSAGFFIALVGVRVLEPLTDIKLAGANDLQQGLFYGIDIILTAGLLGGGSEGVHKVLTVITDFLDQTRGKIKKLA